MINRTKINKQVERAKGGKLQDMTGDNKVTQKDVINANL